MGRRVWGFCSEVRKFFRLNVDNISSNNDDNSDHGCDDSDHNSDNNDHNCGENHHWNHCNQ